MTQAAHRSPHARLPVARSGPDSWNRGTIASVTVGVTIVALVVAQLVWQLAAADGTLASPLALHVLTGVLRVALGALLTGMVLHRLFGRRPPWPLTMRAHLAGVLVAKAAMWFVASPLVALALFVAGVLVPAALIVRRAG